MLSIWSLIWELSHFNCANCWLLPSVILSNFEVGLWSFHHLSTNWFSELTLARMDRSNSRCMNCFNSEFGSISGTILGKQQTIQYCLHVYSDACGHTHGSERGDRQNLLLVRVDKMVSSWLRNLSFHWRWNNWWVTWVYKQNPLTLINTVFKYVLVLWWEFTFKIQGVLNNIPTLITKNQP